MLDTATRLSMLQERYKSGTTKIFIESLNDALTIITGKLATSEGHESTKRLIAIRKNIEEEIGGLYGKLIEPIKVDMQGFAEISHESIFDALKGETGLGYAFAGMPKATMQKIISMKEIRLVGDKAYTLSELFDNAKISQVNRYKQIIAGGLASNSGYRSIVQRLKEANAKATTDIGAIVHTAISSARDMADNEAYNAFDDVITGWKSISVLDSRTSLHCASLDGRKYYKKQGYPKYEAIPNRPPRHFRCRSRLIPMTDFKTETDRAQNGDNKKPIDSKTNFEGWFGSQSDDFQKNYLGQGRYDLYKSGRMKIKDFVDVKSGEQFTIADIKTKFLNKPITTPKPKPIPRVDKPTKKVVASTVATKYAENTINSKSRVEALAKLGKFTDGNIKIPSNATPEMIDGMYLGLDDVLSKYKHNGKVTRIGTTNNALAQYVPPDKWQPDDGFNMGAIGKQYDMSRKYIEKRTARFKASSEFLKREFASDLATNEFEFSRMTFNHEAWHKIDNDNGLTDIFKTKLYANGYKKEKLRNAGDSVSWYAGKADIDEMFAETGALYSSGHKHLIPKGILEIFEDTIKGVTLANSPAKKTVKKVFAPAKTLVEAEDRIRAMGVPNVTLKGLKPSLLNAVLEAIEKEHKIRPLNLTKVEAFSKKSNHARAMYSPSNRSLHINKSYVKNLTEHKIEPYEAELISTQARIEKYEKEYLGNTAYSQRSVENGIRSMKRRIWEVERRLKDGEVAKTWTVGTALKTVEEQLFATITHEIGHHRHYDVYNGKTVFHYTKLNSVSEYGRTNAREFFAEWYTQYRLHGKDGVPEDMLELFKRIDND